MASLSFIIVSPKCEIDSALKSSADSPILARVERLDDLVEAVAQKRPDALLVALDENPQAVFDALEKLLAPRPLFFFHGPDDSQLILQAMRAGAREYIAPADDAKEQLAAAVWHAAREVGGAAPDEPAPLIALIGAKGGVGTSFVACQLAASLASLGRRTVLVDGHPRHGDVALYLDLAPRYTFASLATGRELVDITYLHTTLVSHSSGVQVLASPKRPEEADAVDVKCVEGQVTENGREAPI